LVVNPKTAIGNDDRQAYVPAAILSECIIRVDGICFASSDCIVSPG